MGRRATAAGRAATRNRNRRAATARSGADSSGCPRGAAALEDEFWSVPSPRCRRRGLSGSPRPRTPLASRRRPQPATLPRPARRRTSSSPTSGSSTCSPRASRRGSSRPAGAEVVPAGTADRGEALSGVGGHGSRLRGQSVSPPPRSASPGPFEGRPRGSLPSARGTAAGAAVRPALALRTGLRSARQP